MIHMNNAGREFNPREHFNALVERQKQTQQERRGSFEVLRLDQEAGSECDKMEQLSYEFIGKMLDEFADPYDAMLATKLLEHLCRLMDEGGMGQQQQELMDFLRDFMESEPCD
jgi:hypothetical protein